MAIVAVFFYPALDIFLLPDCNIVIISDDLGLQKCLLDTSAGFVSFIFHCIMYQEFIMILHMDLFRNSLWLCWTYHMNIHYFKLKCNMIGFNFTVAAKMS